MSWRGALVVGSLAWLSVMAVCVYLAVRDSYSWGNVKPVPSPSPATATNDGYGTSWVTSQEQISDAESEDQANASTPPIPAVGNKQGPKPPLAPTWQTAGRRVGQRATLRGDVKWCDFGSRQRIMYSFDAAGHVGFVVAAGDKAHFSAEQLHSYCGPVEVTGTVAKQGHDLIVHVASPTQIRALASPTSRP